MIEKDDGGMMITGESIDVYRLLLLKQAMELEVNSGLYAKINPWDIAKRKLGMTGTKEDVLDALKDGIANDPHGLAKTFDEAGDKEIVEDKKPAGTRSLDDVVHSVGDIFDITVDTVCNLLSCALDGGSSYWLVICGDLHQRPSDVAMFPDFHNENYSYCFGDGKTVFCDIEEYFDKDRDHLSCDLFELTEDKIKVGLDLMAKNCKHELKNIINNNEDGGTGDAFLQFCLFGEIVY